MAELTTDQIEAYLKAIVDPATRVLAVALLGKPRGNEIKWYGYGKPLLIDYDVRGDRRRAVLHTVSPGPFGHEHMSDRAQGLLWDHSSFNRLPNHIHSIDVGAFRSDGTTVSLGDAEEFFLLTEYAEGRGYFEDFIRMRDDASLNDRDLARADALCDYLVAIHRVEGGDPGLYSRRIRELVGHAECIMGLIDTYPDRPDIVSRKILQEIEEHSIRWRWRLKDRTHRLRQVHGDFHPWNILFQEDTRFCLLDRSRGEWGEPADDVTCLTMNYVFFSLQRAGRLEGNFETLFRRFWERYLENSADSEILQVAAPFFAFRGLVMAHPVWYPNLGQDVRRKLFNFMQAVLTGDAFDPGKVNQYCGG
jgi:Phosphotransferase enzyme family